MGTILYFYNNININNFIIILMVLENGRATLYWDPCVITGRTIVANKPDIYDD